MKRLLKFVLKFFLAVSAITIFLLILPRLVTEIYARSRLFEMGEMESSPVAIIFGAGLRRDGSPTPVLRDRVQTGAELFFEGKVERLIMSGYNPSQYYNEPAAMRDFAISLGVPADAIILDLGGARTYDSCLRAHQVFGVTEAVLVSQKYHLPRAIYTCNQLNISAVGVSADRRPYLRRSSLFWNLREIPATFVAFWELHITRQTSAVASAPNPGKS